MVLNYKKTDAMLDITDRKLHHVAPHLHGVLEMVYVTEGTLEIGVGTELYHMEEGDFTRKVSVEKLNEEKNRNSPRELAYSEDFILSCVDKCKELNNYQGLQQFIDVYETVGNVIPVWPGANVHRGQFCCYDCPDIYFNNEKIRDHALAFYNKYSNSYMCGDDAIIAGIYNNMSVKNLINMDKDEYENYIEHAINVIKWRTEKIE